MNDDKRTILHTNLMHSIKYIFAKWHIIINNLYLNSNIE